MRDLYKQLILSNDKELSRIRQELSAGRALAKQHQFAQEACLELR